jgi:hypothetical protein
MEAQTADLAQRLRRRLTSRIGAAMAFLVATAWSNFFQDLFDVLTGGRTSIVAHALYAVLFTVLAAVVAVLTGDDDDGVGY